MTTPAAVTQSYEPTVAWPIEVALNGLAVKSNSNSDVWADVDPGTDVGEYFSSSLGGGLAGEQTMLLSILDALAPSANPYGVAHVSGGVTTYIPRTVATPVWSGEWAKPIFDAFSSLLADVSASSAAAANSAKTMADQYKSVPSWDNGYSGIETLQNMAAVAREKNAATRSFGNVFTMNFALSGMTAPAFAPSHAGTLAVISDFDAVIELSAVQQQGEMFMRRWSAAVRIWEAKQRGGIGKFTLSVDQSKAYTAATNDVNQLNDHLLEQFWTWNFEPWHYLLNVANVLSGNPVQPRDMTKKERLLAAVTTSASTGIQTGASMGNPAIGVGMGALSLFGQLWGMQ